jgi:GNAT superfamily N-acetyltransferase
VTTLRLATVDDVEQLTDLRWAFFVEEHPDEVLAEDRPAFASRFGAYVRRALADGRWSAWVADAGDRLVANVWIQLIEKVPRPNREHRTIGYVSNVYCRPEARGAGIGGALLAETKAWATAQRAEMLLVWPSDDSVSLYERAGFSWVADALDCELLGYDA